MDALTAMLIGGGLALLVLLVAWLYAVWWSWRDENEAAKK